jgi:hypothetical protein
MTQDAPSARSVGRAFYRLVRESPPTVQDFLSNAAQGRTLASSDAELQRRWEGISVFDSLERARQHARRRPELGRFIAELWVTEGMAVDYERTGNTRGHYTLWGEPDIIRQCVVGVEVVTSTE